MHHSFSLTRLPAVYIGKQPGFRDLPSLELYNLVAPVGEHPAGSTVCRATLEKHGWRWARSSKRIGQRPRALAQSVAVDALSPVFTDSAA